VEELVIRKQIANPRIILCGGIGNPQTSSSVASKYSSGGIGIPLLLALGLQLAEELAIRN